MEPKTILILSDKCYKRIDLGDLCLQLDLPHSYRFSKSRRVRIHSVAGLHEEVFVFASFALPVPFAGTLRRHLGIVTFGSLPGPWTLVDGKFISDLSTLTLSKISGEPFSEVPDHTFAILLELDNGV